MANLQLALLLLFSAGVSSKGIDSLHFHQRRANQRSLSLLSKMTGKIHPDCLKERMDFMIPLEIVQPQQCQKENTTIMIHEMLQQIFLLFSRKNVSAGVDKTIVEAFLNGIYQQMVHLEMSLEKKTDQTNSTWGSEESILHLKNYYQRIMDYLKSKEYSSCSCKIVQVETRRNFIFLYKLTRCLKN